MRKPTPRQLERVKVVVLGGAGGARREGLCPSNVLTTADSEEASKLLKRCRSQRVGSIRSEHLDNYGGGELGGGAPLRHRLSGSGSRPPEPDVEMKRDMRGSLLMRDGSLKDHNGAVSERMSLAIGGSYGEVLAGADANDLTGLTAADAAKSSGAFNYESDNPLYEPGARVSVAAARAEDFAAAEQRRGSVHSTRNPLAGDYGGAEDPTSPQKRRGTLVSTKSFKSRQELDADGENARAFVSSMAAQMAMRGSAGKWTVKDLVEALRESTLSMPECSMREEIEARFSHYAALLTRRLYDEHQAHLERKESRREQRRQTPRGRALAAFAGIKFAAWSRNTARISALAAAASGVVLMLCHTYKPKASRAPNEMLAAVLYVVAGVLLFAFEHTYSRGVEIVRPLLLGATAAGGMLYLELQTAATCLVAAALLAACASARGEAAEPTLTRMRLEARRREVMSEAAVIKAEGDTDISDLVVELDARNVSALRRSLRIAWLRARVASRAGAFIFLVLYVGGNVAAFVHWFIVNKAIAEEKGLSSYAPWAKGFGQVLNLNCTVILLPVLRPFMAIFHSTVFGRGLSTVLPVAKAIEFHKEVVFGIIVIATVGHVVCHLLNYSFARQASEAAFAVMPKFWTGVGITLAMVLMAAAGADHVRRRSFETFWAAHHLFIVFWGLLMYHGPRFYMWATAPLALYLAMRIARSSSKLSRRVVVLSSCLEPPNVLKITMRNAAKGGRGGRELFSYKEGMYIKLCCPALSGMEWHPFTISSAPEDQVLTVHIKCGKSGSWTQRLKDFMSSLSGDSEGGGKAVALAGPTADGGYSAGAIMDAHGRQILKIDGPYPAPCQHMPSYKVLLLVGAGIGLTPFASALRSIVEHKWPAGAGPDTIYFHWTCRLNELEAFMWFVRQLVALGKKYAFYRDRLARLPQVRMACTIWLTGKSTPEDIEAVRELVRTAQSTAAAGRASDDGGDGGSEATDGSGGSDGDGAAETSQAAEATEPAAKETQEQVIEVRAGRPQWDPIFSAIADEQEGQTIGVFHCGPMERDLQRMCVRHTRIKTMALHGERSKTVFKLHAEQVRNMRPYVHLHCLPMHHTDTALTQLVLRASLIYVLPCCSIAAAPVQAWRPESRRAPPAPLHPFPR